MFCLQQRRYTQSCVYSCVTWLDLWNIGEKEGQEGQEEVSYCGKISCEKVCSKRQESSQENSEVHLQN
jgi:hypothetical protein